MTARVLHASRRRARRSCRCRARRRCRSRAVAAAVDGERRRRDRARAPPDRRPAGTPATLPSVGSLLAGRFMRIGPVLRRDRSRWPGTMIGSVSVACERDGLAALADDDDLRARDGEAADDLQRARDRAEAAARNGDAAGDGRCRSRWRRCRSSDRRSTCSRSPPSSRCSCCSRSGRPPRGPPRSRRRRSSCRACSMPPQQKSLVFAAQGPLALQAALTQVTGGRHGPVVVLQIFAEP